MEKWLNSSPSQGDIHGFESRWGHQTGLYANPRFYCDGKVIVKSIDLKPYIERRRIRLAKQKNH